MNKSFYILGLPIEIEDVGKLNFIKIKDLPQFSFYQNILIIPKEKLVKLYIDNIDIDEKEDKDELYKYIIKNVSLYKLIKNMRELHDLYLKAFEFCFKEDVSNKITENNFEQIRQLIMDMNCLKEEEFNPNPEIQKWIEKSKKFKSEGNITVINNNLQKVINNCSPRMYRNVHRTQIELQVIPKATMPQHKDEICLSVMERK